MLKTAYEHPPRELSFYLQYIGRFALILSPILLTYVFFIPLPEFQFFSVAVLPPLIVLLLLVIFVNYRALMHIIVMIEDEDIDKGNDVTAFNYDTPPKLDEIMLQLELNGFERMGEIEVAIGVDEPVIEWVLTKDDGKILAEVIYYSKTSKHFMAFTSYTTAGWIATAYGSNMRKVNKADIRTTAISTTLDDALAYHILQIREMSDSPGDVFATQSMQHHGELEKQFKHVHLRERRELLRLFMISRIFLSLFCVAILTLFLIGLNPVYAIIPITSGIISIAGIVIFHRYEKAIDPTNYLKQFDTYPTSLEASA